MQLLRALKCFSLIALIPLLVYGEPAEISMKSSITSSKGNPSVVFPDSHQREGHQHSVDFQSARFSNGFLFSGRLEEIKSDYSNYSLQDEFGNETFLDREFNGSERSTRLGLNYDRAWFGMGFSHSTSLGPTPFAHQVSQISQTTRLFHGLTQLQTSFEKGHLQQPRNFFTDLKTAERKARPTSLNVSRLATSVEQIVNAHLKLGATVEGSDKTDRPRSLGGTVKTAIALTPRDFLKLEGSQFAEQRADALRDEKGYFDLESGELTYSRYFGYDWSGSLSYGLVKEREDNPQNSREDVFAVDVYSLSATFQGRRWSAGFNAQQQISNLKYQAFQLGGQFQWIY